MRIGGFAAAAIALCVAATGALRPAMSQEFDLSAELSRLTESHERIEAARQRVIAADESRKSAMAIYYPSLSATTSLDRQKIQNPNAADTALTGNATSLILTQRVYDFGANYARIDLAERRVERSETEAAQIEQQLLLAAMAAYLDVIRTDRVMDFARQSVANIVRQTELEDERVTVGGGFSTDVLQAKSQLAGALSRETLVQGDIDRARYRFEALFDRPAPPGLPAEAGDLRIVPNLMPASLEVALEAAIKGNPSLELARLDQEIAKTFAVETERDLYFPNLDLVAEQNWDDNIDGVRGTKIESKVKLELSYQFDFGLTMRNSVRAADAEFNAAVTGYGDLVRLVEEQVKAAWSQVAVARRNADLLENQSQIAAEFLELAREERLAGRRSLIDILAGETALFDARADAFSARLTVVQAELVLLAAMGALNPFVLETGPAG